MLSSFSEVFSLRPSALTKQGQSHYKANVFKADIRQALYCVSRASSFMIRQGVERKQTAAGHTVENFPSLLFCARKFKVIFLKPHLNKKINYNPLIWTPSFYGIFKALSTSFTSIATKTAHSRVEKHKRPRATAS